MDDGSGWVALLEAAIAAQADEPASKYAQLATIDADGRPAVRTVRVRFLLEGGRAVASVDARSPKVREIGAGPAAELCWYFAGSREQFRIRGVATVADASATGPLSDARLRCWSESSPDSRATFAWPTPGEPAADPRAFEVAPPDSPPPTFAIVALTPDRVDYLDLRPRPHRRSLYEAGPGGWRGRRINP